jgi:hypothetical protein
MAWARAVALAIIVFFAAPQAFAQTPTFAVGQVWSLQAPMDPAARVHVGAVEDNGQTVHISLWGQPIAEAGPLGSPLTAGHLPISAEALGRSIDALVDEAPPPDLTFAEGYEHWREAQGGVFTLTVHEIVLVMVETIAGGQVSADK